jgi:hypothetical protein
MQKAHPTSDFVENITDMFVRQRLKKSTDTIAQSEEPAFCACLEEWLKRMTEVNEELPGIFQVQSGDYNGLSPFTQKNKGNEILKK